MQPLSSLQSLFIIDPFLLFSIVFQLCNTELRSREKLDKLQEERCSSFSYRKKKKKDTKDSKEKQPSFYFFVYKGIYRSRDSSHSEGKSSAFSLFIPIFNTKIGRNQKCIRGKRFPPPPFSLFQIDSDSEK